MQDLIGLITGVGLILAVIYLLGFCYRTASWPKTILKTVSVLCLAIASLIAQAPLFLSLALLACAAGDYYLSRDGDDMFLKGVGAFALGHIFYIILFFSDPLSVLSRAALAPQMATLSMLFFMAPIMGLLLWRPTGQLRYPVMAYIIIITLMAISAATLPWQLYYNAVLTGVMLFILSDLVLSTELFLLGPQSGLRKITPFMVWVLYWAGQFLIAIGYILRSIE